MEHYAIIGFGCAGYHGAKSLRAHGFAGEIHVYTDTGAAPENPMLTTYFTADRIPADAAYPFGTLEEITRDLRLTVHVDRVTHVDPAKREVAAGDCAVSVDVQTDKPQAVGLWANAAARATRPAPIWSISAPPTRAA